MGIDVKSALGARKTNDRALWHSADTLEKSTNERDASRRILDGFADIRSGYTGTRLVKDDAVFTMGSCFAREIEHALRQRGGNVVSISPAAIAGPEFSGVKRGKTSQLTSFFHRYTPRSMWHEFHAAFDELPSWDIGRSLLFELDSDSYSDLNYVLPAGADTSLAGTLKRRMIARDLVRTAETAKVVVVTLGLIESWRHVPSGLYANRFDPKVALRHRDDFEFELADFDDTMTCLEEIYQLVRSRHTTGDFRFVVTVSPVPLGSTFTTKDIVVANMDSKSTLRAAAYAFVSRHPNSFYFPSYEMVTYSDPVKAWRPDRMHVMPEMVGHIMSTFISEYYEPKAFLN